MPIDYSRYPPNWKSEIRPRILARANDCCEVAGCGVRNYTMVERFYKNGTVRMTKIILTVAHLDQDPDNWAVTDDRLMAMCQMHHLNYDRKECTKRRAGQQAASHKFGKNFKRDQLTLSL
jgi:hypothetical protein